MISLLSTNSSIRGTKSPAMEHCLMGAMPCPFLIQLQNQVRSTVTRAMIVYYSALGRLLFPALLFLGGLFFFFCKRRSNVCALFLDESGPDDGAAKANPSLTREKDLVVNISDLDNIFDEDEEELGVRNYYSCTLFVCFFFPSLKVSLNAKLTF